VKKGRGEAPGLRSPRFEIQERIRARLRCRGPAAGPGAWRSGASTLLMPLAVPRASSGPCLSHGAAEGGIRCGITLSDGSSLRRYHGPRSGCVRRLARPAPSQTRAILRCPRPCGRVAPAACGGPARPASRRGSDIAAPVGHPLADCPCRRFVRGQKLTGTQGRTRPVRAAWRPGTTFGDVCSAQAEDGHSLDHNGSGPRTAGDPALSRRTARPDTWPGLVRSAASRQAVLTVTGRKNFGGAAIRPAPAGCSPGREQRHPCGTHGG
jgi:hypothetical protein